MVKPARQYDLALAAFPLAPLLFLLLLGTHLLSCTGSSSRASATKLAAAGADEACTEGRDAGDCPWGSEASRRALQQAQRYISYEFLRADAVPCSRAGLPYYNCHALPRTNPYSRGCLTITRCARDSGP